MRDLTAEFITAIQAGEVPIGLIVEIDYPNTPLRCWSGPDSLLWDGKTWIGVGELGGISAIQESAKLQAPSMSLQISGVPSTNKALALANDSQRRRATIWLAVFTVDAQDNWSVVNSPYRVRRGWTDTHEGLIGRETSTLKVNVEGPLSLLTVASPVRYTGVDQKRQFPGDTGMDRAGTIGDKLIYWGAEAPSAGVNSGGASRTPSMGGNR